MNKEKHIGIWIRVSTDFQVRDESPEHHERRARLYAESKGWIVEEVYRLEAMSGKSVNEYPETKRMLADMKSGRIQGLIFSKLARLARNTKELLEFAEIFRTYDADLISLSENIDTSTPAGRLFYTMIAAMAAWEREEIAERVAASVPIRAQMGKPLGGQASYGYTWNGKELQINEAEAPIRKLIYELFLKNKRKKTTADILNEKGYRTRNGSKFSDTTVDRLLRDSTAKGIRKANYTKSLGDKKNWIVKPESEWISIPCPAIISEDIWDECNRILNEQGSKRIKRGPQSNYLLAGYLHCACGKKMYVFHASPVYTCKTCKTKIAVEDIDSIFQDQLKSFLLSDTDINDYLFNSNQLITEKEQLLSVLLKEYTSIEKKMTEFVNMRVNNEITKDSFATFYKPLEERFEQMKLELPDLQAELDIFKIQYLSSDTVIKGAQDLYSQWETLANEDKRNIVELITDKITVGKEDIDISLAYLPSFSQNTGNNQRNLKDSSMLQA